MSFEYMHKGDQLVYDSYLPKSDNPFLFIEMAGYTQPKPTYWIKRDQSFHQPLFVLEYVLEGKGTIVSDGQKYTVGKGDFYLLNCMYPHEYFADKEDPFGKVWINVFGSFVEKNVEAFGFPPVLIRSIDVMENFNRIHGMLKGKTAYEVKQMTEQLSVEIFRLLYKVWADITNMHEESNRLLHIENYIRNHIADGVTVDRVCAENFISNSTLYRLFKKEKGISPTEYIQNMKISIASKMLKKTSIDMHEIVRQLGFYDYSHFSRIFQAQKGLSPAAYRKKHHEKK